MPSVRPPADEQQRIVDFIAKRTETLEAAQRQTQQQIETLREYRTRLIADVVTGKLDVTGFELPLDTAAELAASAEPSAAGCEQLELEETSEVELMPEESCAR
jgi:type I restriction enzyme S subunit